MKVFPKNAEFAARITFRSDDPKPEVSNIISGNTLSLVIRHSLIALPEPGYIPRTDPFGYSIGRQQVDYSAPLGKPVVIELGEQNLGALMCSGESKATAYIVLPKPG